MPDKLQFLVRANVKQVDENSRGAVVTLEIADVQFVERERSSEKLLQVGSVIRARVIQNNAGEPKKYDWKDVIVGLDFQKGVEPPWRASGDAGCFRVGFFHYGSKFAVWLQDRVKKRVARENGVAQ